MKKYVVDGFFLTQKVTGTQRYAYEIVAELDKLVTRGTVTILVPEYVTDLPTYKNINTVKYGRHKGILWQQTDLAAYLRREKALGIFLGNVLPLVYRKGIVAIHDISYKVNPQFHVSVRDRLSGMWHILHYIAAARSQMEIITVSRFSKREIVNQYRVNPDRIHVVSNAWQHMERIAYSESTFERYPMLNPGKYFFSMSTLAANKNFKWVLYAAKNNPNETFALAGGGKLKGVAEAMGLVDLPNVHFLGYVSDEDAKTLMRDCKAFLFPTLYEGFGIPPLEAMACGAQAVVSDIEVMHEVYGDCVHYIDPHNNNVLLNELSFIEPLDNKAVLDKYSWRMSAERLRNVMQRL